MYIYIYTHYDMLRFVCGDANKQQWGYLEATTETPTTSALNSNGAKRWLETTRMAFTFFLYCLLKTLQVFRVNSVFACRSFLRLYKEFWATKAPTYVKQICEANEWKWWNKRAAHPAGDCRRTRAPGAVCATRNHGKTNCSCPWPWCTPWPHQSYEHLQSFWSASWESNII